jgi:O-antigen/teichoic acid export membrane protein
MISKSFIKSSLIYTLAGMLPMASAIILLPLYIHNLSTEAYGALTVYMVFTFLVQIVVTFSFDSSLYIHYHELKEDKKKLSVFVSSAFVFMLVLAAAVAIILAGTGDLLFYLALPDKDISFYPYGLSSVGAGIFQAIFKVHGSLLQSREKPETFFWSNVLSFSLIAFFIVMGLELYPNSIFGPVIGRLVGSIIPCLWALIRVFREFGFHYDFAWLRSSFSFNAYTFIYQILQWVINQFDRILMLFFLALSDVGVYDFAIKCLIPVELLMNSLHSSFYPKVISTVMAQDNKGSSLQINRYYHGLTAVVMLITCGSILVLPWAIETFVSKPGYHAAIPYIPYIAVFYFFRTARLFFSVPYGILKYSKPLPAIYLAVSMLKIVLMILLIGRLNIYGVIIASLLSALLENILLKVNLRNMFQFKFNIFKMVLAPLILVILILILEPTIGIQYPYPTHLFYVASCGGLLWWAYRNEVQLINPFRASSG